MKTTLGLDQDLINAVTRIVEACSSKKMEKEELHPNQVKLDKNKNGKLDADDFKKLRKEDAEELDELSKKTLGSYVRKASIDTVDAVHGERDAENDEDHAAQEYHARRVQNRMSGLERVGKKLAKEEVEELDEASIKLFMGMHQVWHKGKKIASYASKTDAQDHVNSLKEELEEGMEEFAKSQAKKRAEARKAKEKMSEEVEELEELSKDTLKSYVAKAEPEADKLGDKYSTHRFKRDKTHGHFSNDTPELEKLGRKAANREDGVWRANKKLNKEQMEEIEALAAKHGLGE